MSTHMLVVFRSSRLRTYVVLMCGGESPGEREIGNRHTHRQAPVDALKLCRLPGRLQERENALALADWASAFALSQGRNFKVPSPSPTTPSRVQILKRQLHSAAIS